MTRFIKKCSGALTLTCLAFLVNGCDSQVSEYPIAGESVQNTTAPELITRSATQLPEGVTGKPGAGVEVDYQLPETIQPGEVVTVRISFTPPAVSGSLNVELSPENLTLINSPDSFEFALGQYKELMAEVSVYSGETIKGYLNLFLTVASPQGSTASQVVSLPVQFGDIVQSTELQKTTDANGQRLHILPAEETIITSEK